MVVEPTGPRFLILQMSEIGNNKRSWEPPARLSHDEVIKMSDLVLNMPDLKLNVREDIFRIRCLDLNWDIGVMVYEPGDPSKLSTGPDGKKAGIFLLHGGMGDYKSLDRIGRTLADKFGLKVASMTYPGRLYLPHPTRDWPGDTLNPDGTARTPIWSTETQITADQYEVVKDTSKRASYGTLVSLAAKAGTEFYYRMAAWPVAFEEAMKETARRHLPEDQYSIYIHGHSTGGPFAMMATQRIRNIAGVIGYGTSPFGYMYTAITGDRWDFPFNHLRLRTWRDAARYLYEGLKDKGYGLPMLMELTFERWEEEKKRANFKAEDFVHKNSVKSLKKAARTTAERLRLCAEETAALVEKYLAYTRELSGPGVKPVPHVLSLHGVDDDTVTLARCEKSLAYFSAVTPSPKVRCVLLGAGVHTWYQPEEGLPQGIIPPVARIWYNAIMNGFFLPDQSNMRARL
jgi:hypothetical protein